MYDVFISFKNLDADGNRTEDSFIAERLYELFKEQGLNVFYSNKVLNELGAASYKKEIEEALENSSVLVSVATKKEFLESQWVAYERESFHNDILSGRKVKACIVPFLKGITGLDVPRSLRNYQTFQIGISSNGEVVDFVKKFLKSEDKKESFNYHKEEISLITGKHLSSYKAENKSELKRLRIQAINTREPDQNAIKYVLDHMPQKEQLSILDMGCAYGFVTKDRFAKIPNAKVIGVDRSEILIDYAKENSMFNGASYYVLDLEDEEVIDNLYEIMQKENIEKFDIIFASLVIHHLKNPSKLLRNIRKVLADDGLIQKVVDLHLSCDGISDRLNGRKIYSQLVSSGYKNVKMINWVKEVSGMDLDERNEIFIERFSYRKNYIKTQCEKDPYNAANRKKLEEMEYLLSELENKFSEESFWYSEIDFVGVAQKK